MFFRTANAIPIAGKYEDENLLNKAFEDIDQALADGDVVCIFPEGKLTTDGEMNNFRDGVEKIIQRRAVSVVPMALQGLWGSIFSRDKNNIFHRLMKGFKSRINLVIGDAVEAPDASASVLQNKVKGLYGSKV